MATQNLSFDFPQPLTEKYRPLTIDGFVGLDKPKNIMRKLAANPKQSAWTFVGPSGTGKTTMALALAAMIPAELHHITSQNCNLDTIERVRRTCQYLPMSGFKFHVVLVDEANYMSVAAQRSLLSKLDSTDPAPNTIWIFTCNSLEGLEKPFLSRTHQVEFSSYGMCESVAGLLNTVWDCEAADCPKPNFARMVERLSQ